MKTAYFDGAQMKGFNVPDPWHSTEGWIPAAEPTADNELYGRVAALFSAMNLSADALSNVNFAIVKGGKDFDVSNDWQNKVGFMPNPVNLLRLWRLSLFATNMAYAFMEFDKGKKELRYIVPTTITPNLSKVDGSLESFTRDNGLSRTTWPFAPISPKSPIFHMWRQDHTTELVPSKYSEMYACMSAAGILQWSDYFVEQFFQRGGVIPHILLIKGAPGPEAQAKIENGFTKLIKGAYREIGKVFNAEFFDVKPLATGIESLKESSIHDNAISNIAMAARMPLSLLLANSANWATAQTEYYSWYINSVFPWCNFMAGCMNEYLFEPIGLKWEFRPEQSTPDQEQEVQRASAYKTYIDAKMLPSIAAQVVGIDLPQGVEYEDLDPDEEQQEPEQAQTIPPQLQPEAQPEEQPEPDDDEMQEDDTPAKFVPSVEQYGELYEWRTMALRKHNQGKALPVDFVAKTLPDEIANTIRARLKSATNDATIKEAFTLDGLQPQSEIVILANAINRLAEKK